MTAVLPSDVDRLEAHEIPAEHSATRMRAFVEKPRGQIGVMLAAMTAAGEDVTAAEVAEGFSGATTEGVALVLECLQVAPRVAQVVEDDGSERWVLRA